MTLNRVAHLRHFQTREWSELTSSQQQWLGCELALLVCMHFGRVLLLVSLATGLLAAENGTVTRDPFAGYRDAIETRLADLLERNQAPPPQIAPTTPIESEAVGEEKTGVDVKAFARRFWRGRESDLVLAFGRWQQLRPRLEPILASVGIPRELAAVVLVESGAHPLATSPRGARGLWQLIPETALQYGLQVNRSIDERISVESATQAAARFLRDLYNRFGDWPLALAAYNVGPKAVEEALQKGRMRTFFQLSSAGLLPQETRAYVPAVLAAMRLAGPGPIVAQASEPAKRETRVYASVGASN